MDDTLMVSNKLSNDNWEGSLVFHKSSTRDLRHLNPSSISMLTFVGCRLGFGVPSYGGVGFWFSLVSMLIMCFSI
jgi:hypothetical protein